MSLNIVRDDLANVRADAVVLPSNTKLIVDGGAGQAVAKKAGLFRVRRACRKLGGCPVGGAVATPAFGHPARYLIHAVGPHWTGGAEDARLLQSAYAAALELAAQLGCESVALPLLSAGTFGCPAHVSLSIALTAVEAFLEHADVDVTLVLFDKKAVAACLDFIGEIESRIDDAYAELNKSSETAPFARAMPDAAPTCAGQGRRFGAPSAREFAAAAAPVSAPVPESDRSFCCDAMGASTLEDTTVVLEGMMDHMEEGFSQTLLGLIDRSGMTDAQVYRRANMSRQHFSKIRGNAGYHPSKATVLALCVALRLDLAQTRDLLARAGFALSHASKFDIVVEYFIEHGIYDQFAINETLFYFDQPLLGG